MFVRNPMERLLSSYVDKMVEDSHKSLVPYREYVRNEGKRLMNLRQQKEKEEQESKKQEQEPKEQTRIGRKLQAANESSPSSPNKPIADAMSKDEIERMLIEHERPKNQSVDTNETVKPTFEEFLEFILATNLRGIIKVPQIKINRCDNQK